MITRFAPSPTGLLHLGHVFAAKVAFDVARAAGGKFLLRFEDIDHTRVRPEFYAAIEEDLRWLGLNWDGEALRQLNRLHAYDEALEKLKTLGVVYPCFCTRRAIDLEIAQITNAPHGPEGALYPGTCRHITPEQAAEKIALNEAHCWRLHCSAASRLVGELTFHDQRFGLQKVDPFLTGDVILARKDIATSYHLAVVVDDAFQEVMLVTRGEDLLTSTHVHRVLQKLLRFPEPIYFHHRLVMDGNGKRLAKRDEARSIRSLREEGKTRNNVLNLLEW